LPPLCRNVKPLKKSQITLHKSQTISKKKIAISYFFLLDFDIVCELISDDWDLLLGFIVKPPASTLHGAAAPRVLQRG
jgi:hypothetical protein